MAWNGGPGWGQMAGTGALFIYLLSLIPGYIMPIVQLYGGRGRLWSCLLPPSALTVWSEVLIALEVRLLRPSPSALWGLAVSRTRPRGLA